MYARSGSTWTSQGEPLHGEEFGQSLALSRDGSTALISGYRSPYGLGRSYATAWVETRSGTTWTAEELEWIGTRNLDRAPDVALSADGNTALVGGAEAGGRVGAAWVFTRSGSTWTRRGEELTAAGEIGSGEFGSSVSLSADGTTALIGGPGDGAGHGAAWVFTHSASGWTQQGEKLTGSGDEGAFGADVALSEDGNTALIGDGGQHGGGVWLFKRTGSVWTQQGERLTNGVGDFGSSLALSSNGGTALIGGGLGNLSYHESGVGGVWAFEFLPLPASAPTAVTGVASDVTPSSATLTATVNPNSGNVIDCHFQYGPTGARRRQGPCSPNPGSGEGPVAVSAAVSDLQPNTTYRFRIVARNAEGRSVGSYAVFTTAPPHAPSATSDPALSITATSATLNATVNPNGERVRNCRFEYGATTEYGSVAPCSPSPGSGAGPVAVSAHLRGLSEYTTYHFRILARNRTGSSEGSDLTFTTLREARSSRKAQRSPPHRLRNRTTVHTRRRRQLCGNRSHRPVRRRRHDGGRRAL